MNADEIGPRGEIEESRKESLGQRSEVSKALGHGYMEQLTPSHVGQVLNDLKASGLRAGLLLNFGKPGPQYRRVLL